MTVSDAAARGAKVMQKRRMRNNFNKWLDKVKSMRRADHIASKVQWFTNTRSNTSANDCFQSWRLYIRRYKLAKKFLMRSGSSIDKQLANEAFSVWKQMCSVKRQKLYIDNIEELERRKDEHED